MKSNYIATIHAADFHVGGFRFAFEYLERTAIALDAMYDVVAQVASTVEFCVFLIAGDFWHGKTQTEPERCLGHRFIGRVSLIPNVTVVMLEGNHDYYDHSGITMLHTFKALGKSIPNLRIVTGSPRTLNLKVGKHTVSYMCVPCQQHLTTAKMGEVLGRMRKTATGDVVYGAIHECFAGSSNESGYAYKSSLELPEDDNVAGYMLGDIHLRQQIGRKAYYCGTPWQTRFDEVETKKGVLVWRPENREPEFVRVLGVPRLIETLVPEHAEKLANTAHTVRYIGRKPLTFTAPNVSHVPKAADIQDEVREGVVATKDINDIRAVTKVDLLGGLETFFAKKKADAEDIEMAMSIAKEASEAV